MKKLSRKTVEEAADVLNIGIRGDGSLFIIDHSRDVLVPIKGKTKQLDLKALGIQLEPEMPETSIQNLGKFMVLFGSTDEPYPKADFKNIRLDQTRSGFLMAIDMRNERNGHIYDCDGGCSWHECTITDPRWHCIEHESCELCDGVRS